MMIVALTIAVNGVGVMAGCGYWGGLWMVWWWY